MDAPDQIRQALDQGGPQAAAQLLPPVYEAYLRLVGAADRPWHGRAHFFAAAAEAMRRILVESARRKHTLKRGGDRERLPLEGAELLAPQPREDVLALDGALPELAATDRAAADLVQLRYFGGLSRPDAAQVLGVSPRTAERLWAFRPGLAPGVAPGRRLGRQPVVKKRGGVWVGTAHYPVQAVRPRGATDDEP
jgi:RNA polymerase sigma factor (TIGR02999 family)